MTSTELKGGGNAKLRKRIRQLEDEVNNAKADAISSARCFFLTYIAGMGQTEETFEPPSGELKPWEAVAEHFKEMEQRIEAMEYDRLGVMDYADA